MADTSAVQADPINVAQVGAWDGDPDKNIISYKTALGVALLGKKPGDTVKVKTGGTEEEYTVVNIKRYADTASS